MCVWGGGGESINSRGKDQRVNSECINNEVCLCVYIGGCPSSESSCCQNPRSCYWFLQLVFNSRSSTFVDFTSIYL